MCFVRYLPCFSLIKVELDGLESLHQITIPFPFLNFNYGLWKRALQE